MSNRLPSMANSLDGMMQQELAAYCKKLMKDTGVSKADAITWCADRFDDNGVLAVHEYVTDNLVYDKITMQTQPLVIKPGLVFEIDHDKLEDFIVYLLREKLDNLAEFTMSFSMVAMDHGAYVIWKMCSMLSGVAADDQLRVAYGVLFGSKGVKLLDGDHKSSAHAFPLLLTLMSIMVTNGVLVPKGEMMA